MDTSNALAENTIYACTFLISPLAPGYSYSWRKDTGFESDQRSIYVAILRKIPKAKEVKLQYYPLSVFHLVN